MKNYVVFDLETTGLSICRDTIIEIAACKVENGNVIDRFHTLVNPKRPLLKQITEITGITEEVLSSAPTLDEVIESFLIFIGDSVLVGHNICSFDIRFIEAEIHSVLKNKIVDTLRLSHVCLEGIKDYKLASVAKALDITVEESHRAMSDVETNLAVFKKLIDLCEEMGIDIFESSTLTRGLITKEIWKPNYSEDTITLQALQDLLRDVIKDNKVDESEVYIIKEWIDRNEQLRGNYPFDKVFASLEQILEDGIVEDSERVLLMDVFAKLLDPVNNTTHEVVCTICGKHCVITGEFTYGDRSKVEAFIESKGGVIDKSVKKTTDYVIVGAQGSAAWKQGNYGGKIKQAMEYNEKYSEKGVNISIISEEDFFKEIK